MLPICGQSLYRWSPEGLSGIHDLRNMPTFNGGSQRTER